MKDKVRIGEFLFYMLVGTTYAYALSRLTVAATILEVTPLHLYALCASLMFAFYVVFLNRKTILVSLSAVGIVLLLALISLATSHMQAEWFLDLSQLTGELLLFAQERLPLQERYNQVLGFGISFLFSLLTALGMYVTFNFPLLALMGVGLLLIPMSMDWGHSSEAAVLFLICFVLLFAKRMNQCAVAGGRSGARSNAMFGLAAIPLILLLMAVAWVLPKPGDQVSGPGVQGLRDAADNLLYAMGEDNIFSYTDEGEELGGPINPDDTFVMEVYANERVYLSGSVRDTYTGRAWTVSDLSTQQLVADADGVYSISEYDQSMVDTQQYFRRYYGFAEKAVTVTLRENRTKTIFTPPFRTALALSDAVVPEMDTLGAITVSRPLAAYSTYTQSYPGLNPQNDYFIQYVLMSAEQSYAGVPEQYLALPDSLPQRVHDLAREVTQDAQTPYAQLKALETYLQTFPYTLAPDTVPRGEDFVDYFLFEGQEGYCVYFATAMSVMARSLGIPTRYVEGFAMPAQANANGAFEVTGKQAHAWMEAYFPIVGWVAFEATPPDFVGNAQVPESQTEIPPTTEPVPEPELEQESMVEEQLPEDVSEPVPSLQEQNPPDEETKPMNPLPLALLSLVIILVLAATFVVAMISLYSKRFGRMDAMADRQAVEIWFGRVLLVAAALGYPRLHNETAKAYAQRVGGELRDNEGVDIVILVEMFSRAAYSDEPVASDDRSQMREGYLLLLQRLRETKMNRLQFYWNRYILMRF